MQTGRAPYGARGLKSNNMLCYNEHSQSRPVWGAWIEMSQFKALSSSGAQSRPVWGAWIEIVVYTYQFLFL